MTDIRNVKVLYLKALLLLGVGVFATAILVMENPNLRFAALLAISIWGFCRAYYFAFYVIEHYVDPKFRFSGLWAFVRYSAGRMGSGRSETSE
jgi:hypothetical protein